MQQREFSSSGVLNDPRGMNDFVEGGHARRENERQSRSSTGAEQVVPEKFVGRDLQEVDEGGEGVDGFHVERRAPEFEVAVSTALGKRCEESLGQLPVLACSMSFALSKDFGREEFIDSKELKFDAITADLRRAIDEAQSTIEILGMVARNFGDEAYTRGRNGSFVDSF